MGKLFLNVKKHINLMLDKNLNERDSLTRNQQNLLNKIREEDPKVKLDDILEDYCNRIGIRTSYVNRISLDNYIDAVCEYILLHEKEVEVKLWKRQLSDLNITKNSLAYIIHKMTSCAYRVPQSKAKEYVNELNISYGELQQLLIENLGLVVKSETI